MKPVKSVEEARPRLGRGLAALLGGPEGNPQGAAQPPRGPKKIPVEFLRPNPRNPRRNFGEEELAELTASIKEKGIIQPILARPVPGQPGMFEIIAGERRWRAAQRAGLHEVPIVGVEADDRQALELAIIENVQRADLDPLEEAAGYEQLLDEFNYSQTDLAKVIGKSRSHVANSLRLLKLPEPTKVLLREGKLSAGHARVLLATDEPDALAGKIIAQNLSVRDAEQMLEATPGTDRAKGQGPRKREIFEKPADTRALEKSLRDALGIEAVITHKDGEAGELSLRYKTLDQLELVCRRLKG
jgi:ParB family transcriptional regulator, chromosome partitioning protein